MRERDTFQQQDHLQKAFGVVRELGTSHSFRLSRRLKNVEPSTSAAVGNTTLRDSPPPRSCPPLTICSSGKIELWCVKTLNRRKLPKHARNTSKIQNSLSYVQNFTFLKIWFSKFPKLFLQIFLKFSNASRIENSHKS